LDGYCFCLIFGVMREIIRNHFPALNEFHFLQNLEENAKIVEFKEGDQVMKFGKPLSYVYLVFEGNICVNRMNEDGDEVFLYYLIPGDMCAVSFVCASNERVSQVSSKTLENSRAIAIPVHLLDKYSRDFKCWNQFTMDTLRDRFDELLRVIDSIAFKKLDDRIVEYLEKTCFSKSTHDIHVTHNDIAAALHTSREVVSRLLKRLEADGKVKLHRNHVELLCHQGYDPKYCKLHCDKSH